MPAQYTKLNGEAVLYSNTDAADEYRLFRDVLMDLAANNLVHGIEIGVLNGQMSRYICSLDPRIRLTGIDPIIPDSMEASLIGSEEKIAEVQRDYLDQFQFFKNYSHNVPNRFPEGSVDFCFVDGSHHYQDVRRDYEMYWPKLRVGGIMLFHDSRMNRGGAPFHVGPSRLVDELVPVLGEPIAEAFSLTAFRKV